MIAVDTNILVYAHREDSQWHQLADRCLTQLAESRAPWAIPWPCIHEFVAIATHPRIYNPPTPLVDAIEQVKCWLEAPTLVLLSESLGYAEGRGQRAEGRDKGKGEKLNPSCLCTSAASCGMRRASC